MRKFKVTCLGLFILGLSYSAEAQRVPEHSFYAGGLAQQLSRNNVFFEQVDSELYEQWGVGAELFYERNLADWLSLRLGLRYAYHGSQESETRALGMDFFIAEKVEQFHFTASPLYVYNFDDLSLYAGPGIGFGALRYHSKTAGVRSSFDQQELEAEFHVAANFRFTAGLTYPLDNRGRHRLELQGYWDYQSNQVFGLGSSNATPPFELSSLGLGLGYRLVIF